MDSDHEFLRLRLVIVQRQKQEPDPQLSYTGNHRGKRETREERMAELNREERILRYLLAQTHEGKVAAFLQEWRVELSTCFAAHKQRHKARYDAYDRWCELPWHQKQQWVKPPYPPEANFTDKAGARWVVTERLLEIIDKTASRLNQYMAYSD